MEDIFGLLIAGYVIVSVLVAVFRRAQQGPIEMERKQFDDVILPAPFPTEDVQTSTKEMPARQQGDMGHHVDARKGAYALEPITMHQVARPVVDMHGSRADFADYRQIKRPASGPSERVFSVALHRRLKSKRALREGILLAEVLGPPRSLRGSHRFDGDRMR